MTEIPEKIDSKFRFVLLASKRAEQMVRGARPKVESVSRKPTRVATAFVTPLSLEIMSGHPVYGEEYLTPGNAGVELHIEAAQWADVLCVAPATAHVMARLALGLADDFLTTTALAFSGSVVLA